MEDSERRKWYERRALDIRDGALEGRIVASRAVCRRVVERTLEVASAREGG